MQAAKNIENEEENDAEAGLAAPGSQASSLAEPKLPKRSLEVPLAQTNQVIDLTKLLTENSWRLLWLITAVSR